MNQLLVRRDGPGLFLSLICTFGLLGASCGREEVAPSGPRLVSHRAIGESGIEDEEPGFGAVLNEGPFRAVGGPIQMQAISLVSPEGLLLQAGPGVLWTARGAQLRACNSGFISPTGKGTLVQKLAAFFPGRGPYVSLPERPTVQAGERICLSIPIRLPEDLSPGRYRVGTIEVHYTSNGEARSLAFASRDFMGWDPALSRGGS